MQEDQRDAPGVGLWIARAGLNRKCRFTESSYDGVNQLLCFVVHGISAMPAQRRGFSRPVIFVENSQTGTATILTV